ncbi:hypothetical protein [Thermus tengchongensis]|uniref:hypothetical protein n=1 Tax=Thermus tengchongensis TaxID=1214928 RepID=UPI001F22C85B|nr:hypothetical protein [Thermus tengchongensis]
MRAKRLLAALLALLGLLGALALAHRYRAWAEAPPYRQGQGLAFLPPALAAALCRASEGQALCLQGYFAARIPQEIQGLPERYCQGLSGPAARACSKVMGLRLVVFPSSVRLCERLPDPEACARYVGRGAYARGGEARVKEECGKVRGPLLFNCQVGAAMEMVERRPKENLQAAWRLCEGANPDGTVCTGALGSALLSAVKDRKRAEALCLDLPPLQAARCVAGVKRAAEKKL